MKFTESIQKQEDGNFLPFTDDGTALSDRGLPLDKAIEAITLLATNPITSPIVEKVVVHFNDGQEEPTQPASPRTFELRTDLGESGYGFSGTDTILPEVSFNEKEAIQTFGNLLNITGEIPRKYNGIPVHLKSIVVTFEED